MAGSICIVGLGPGEMGHLTVQALKKLENAVCLRLRTGVHPLVKDLLALGLKFDTYDWVYEKSSDFSEVYQTICQDVIALAQAGQEVVYAVPGHPLVAEESVKRIIQSAADNSINCDVIAGMSFIEPLLSAVGYDPIDGFAVYDAMSLAGRRVDPQSAAVIVQVFDKMIASDVKLDLLDVYPAEHEVMVITAAGVTAQELVVKLALSDLDREAEFNHLTSIFVPPFADAPDLVASYPLDSLMGIMDKLRGEGGCPWDKEQTHQSLKPYVIEEAYEVVDAINNGEIKDIVEELGDLLLQVVFHARLGSERGLFDMNDIVDGECEKMIRRHPHVFAEAVANNSQEVLVNWESIKNEEKGGKPVSVFDSIPDGFPALVKAEKMQKKAANFGFDWPTEAGAWDKVLEEISELRRAYAEGDKEKQSEEIGDLFFSLVNYARKLNINAEVCVLAACSKFKSRISYMESTAKAGEYELSSLDLGSLEALWQASKLKKNIKY